MFGNSVEKLMRESQEATARGDLITAESKAFSARAAVLEKLEKHPSASDYYNAALANIAVARLRELQGRSASAFFGEAIPWLLNAAYGHRFKSSEVEVVFRSAVLAAEAYAELAEADDAPQTPLYQRPRLKGRQILARFMGVATDFVEFERDVDFLRRVVGDRIEQAILATLEPIEGDPRSPAAVAKAGDRWRDPMTALASQLERDGQKAYQAEWAIMSQVIN